MSCRRRSKVGTPAESERALRDALALVETLEFVEPSTADEAFRPMEQVLGRLLLPIAGG
jgi:hypothetical protein